MMRVKINKAFDKHPNIGWWFVFSLFPAITIARSADYIKQIPVYSLTITWLIWTIEFNNNKSY